MPWGMIAGAVIGGVLSSEASGDAADAASGASRDAVAENRHQFDTTQRNAAPWLNSGSAAVNRLAYLLGLDPSSTVQKPILRQAEQMQQQEMLLRTQLAPSFTRTGDAGEAITDEAGLSAAVQRVMASAPNQAGQSQGATSLPGGTTRGLGEGQPNASGGGEFGSLARNFSMQDYQEDPGYQFRLAEGEKGINRAALARGGYDSGATLKGLNRFNQESASAEFQNAFNRFQSNQTNLYNRLAGLSGTGQTSANTLAQAGSQMAQSNGNAMMSAGNSRANAIVGGYGAINQNIQGGLSNYYAQQNQNRFLDMYGGNRGGGQQQTGYGINDGASGQYISNPNNNYLQAFS